jgi:hypothetical protein
MDVLSALAQVTACVGLMWISGMAGIVVADWRDRRAGRRIDRGYWPSLPSDPDY